MKRRFIASMILMLTVFLLLGSILAAQATVRYVSLNPNIDYINNTRDGSSWDHAFSTVQAGVDAADLAGGGQVWVAAGIYHDPITMKSGVEVYGGFAGTEATIGDRPAFPRTSPDANETILDGNAANGVTNGNSVVNIVGSSGSMMDDVVVDGFTIRNGKGHASGSNWNGGGIRCMHTADNVYIRNNNIINNGMQDLTGLGNYGGGIYCYDSSVHINNNTISGNKAVQSGGIYCDTGTVEITNNIISGNTATSFGGGIYAYSAQVTISKNDIRSNTGAYGGGIYAKSLSGLSIKDNIITNNIASSTISPTGGTGGICCSDADGSITNNTIADNNSFGIYMKEASDLLIANNIIAFNGTGLHKDNSAVILNHNCVQGTTTYDSTFSEYGSDIPSADPQFIDHTNTVTANRDYHIMVTSRCRNAGDNSVVQSNETDKNGLPRRFGSRVDIGAYEVQGNIIHVSKSGVDDDDENTHDGRAWSSSKNTVKVGIDTAQYGDVVWVAAGTYHECVTMKAGVELFGGFAGTETTLYDRPAFPRTSPDSHETILDGQRGDGTFIGDSVVNIPGASSTNPIKYVVVDGFTIQNGKGHASGSNWNGGGIRCMHTADTVYIRNNNVINNGMQDLTGLGNYGGGIYCYDSSVHINNNTISGNKAVQSGGIYCDTGIVEISNNIISGNTATSFGGGVFANKSDNTIASQVMIAGNVIRGNTGAYGGAIYAKLLSGMCIKDNIITNNIATSTSSPTGGTGGICCSDAHGSITNNTIADNNSFGIYMKETSDLDVANNIVAFNGTGFRSDNSTVRMSHNCAHSNNTDYNPLTLLQSSDKDFEPRFVDRTNLDTTKRNYHILASSQCANSGDNSFVQNGQTDIDGESRQNGIVDMGADEVYSLIPPTISLWRDSSSVQRVSMTSREGGSISYTINSDPTVISYTPTAQPSITETTTYKNVKASMSGWGESPAAPDKTYTKVATPTFVPGTRFGNTLPVSIASSTPDATIYYTTDGTAPRVDLSVSHIANGGSVSLVARNDEYTLKAIAAVGDMVDSSVAVKEHIKVGTVYYVSWTSGVNNNTLDGQGLSWAKPFKTVNYALTNAISGDQVWVQNDTYNERISVNKDVELYGGFVGNETSVNERTLPIPSQNATILDGGHLGSVVTISGSSSSKPTVVIDGFTIQNGGLSSGAGIRCTIASTNIRNNRIQNNATGSGGLGGGIYCEGDSTFTVENNIISDNTSSYGGGIECGNTTPPLPKIAASIRSNFIVNNTATGNGGGMYFAVDSVGGLSSIFANNTVADNKSLTPLSVGGVRIRLSGMLSVANNIIARNQTYKTGGIELTPSEIVNDSGNTSGTVLASHNCIYAYDDSKGVTDDYVVGYQDPKFVSSASSDYHIALESPCIDSGIGNIGGTVVAYPNDVDIDGQGRVYGGAIDIGADELRQIAPVQLCPSAGTYRGPQKIRLSTNTIGAVIHYTIDGTQPTSNSPIYVDSNDDADKVPVPANATTTVKAIASIGDVFSEVTSAQYVVMTTDDEIDADTLRSVRLNTYNNFGGFQNYNGWDNDKIISVLASKQYIQISEGWPPSLVAAIQRRNTDTKVYVYYTLHQKLSGDNDGDTPGLGASQASSPLKKVDIDSHDWWLYDGNGDSVYEFNNVKTKNGNIVYDTNGNPVYEWGRYIDVGKTGFKEAYFDAVKTRLNYYNDLVICSGGWGIDGIIFDYWDYGLRQSSIAYFNGGLNPLPIQYQVADPDNDLSDFEKDAKWRENAWLPFVKYLANHLRNYQLTDADDPGIQFGHTIIGNCAGIYHEPISNPTDCLDTARDTLRGYIDGTIYELWAKDGDGWLTNEAMKANVDAFLKDDKEAWTADYEIRRGLDSSSILNPLTPEFCDQSVLSLAMYYIALPKVHKPLDGSTGAFPEMRSYNHAGDGATWEPIWDFRIGEPAELGYTKRSDNLWIRKYTHGIVLANYGDKHKSSDVWIDDTIDCTYTLDPGTYYEYDPETKSITCITGKAPISIPIGKHKARILSTIPDQSPWSP